jgi:hypothetical protein
MNYSEATQGREVSAVGRTARGIGEAAGLLSGPQRILPLAGKILRDRLRIALHHNHLYSYTKTVLPTDEALRLLIRWIRDARRPDGGVAAYYSLLSGYSASYPEVTGYLIPTLYDFADEAGDQDVRSCAERAARWLQSLQMSSGAFPGGLHGDNAQVSVFNTGQILHGLTRAHAETKDTQVLEAAVSAAEWLSSVQGADGSWSGHGAYQGVAHTYYSMVSWALAQLSESVEHDRYGTAAERNLDWVLAHTKSNGWIDGINLRGHPMYLHFIAYVIQGVLECGILRRRGDAIDSAARSAWVLLRKFETNKHLLGAYKADFRGGLKFTCVTGNAQMSCVWLRLFEVTRDLRYLNAGLKMNEMLKELIPVRGRKGIVGGVSGSSPIWEAYQPMRYISWGCKFLADALMLEERLKAQFEGTECES